MRGQAAHLRSPRWEPLMATAMRVPPMVALALALRRGPPGLWGCLGLLVILTGPAVGRLSAEVIDPRDLQREVQARQALQNDPKIAPFCLGVRVRNRVATLTGPVPTRELAQHAVNVLRQMPELSDVRS